MLIVALLIIVEGLYVIDTTLKKGSIFKKKQSSKRVKNSRGQ